MNNKKPLPKSAFFELMKHDKISLTFDDVSLKTGYSEILPKDISTNSKFSKNISLNIPIISAAMDTVTEYPLAIEMAKLGGIGVIHKNLTPEEQSYHISRVKFYLNGLIDKPKFVYEDQTISSVLKRREEKNYEFRTFPVLNRNGKLTGILTGNDFDFCDDYSKLVKEVMTKNVITLPQGADLDKAYTLMVEEKKKAIPLIDKQQRLIALYTLKDLKRIKNKESDLYNLDENGQLRVAAAIGVGKKALLRLEKLVKENLDVVVIDTAHADSKQVYETIKEIKNSYNLDVVAGNISEPDSALRLIKAGVDGIKVGQGPGSICTTRVVAGIGAPQLTAIYECSKIADEFNIPVCADGGIKFSGDIAKAIGAGAHSVMIGNMLAGTKESPGEIIFLNGRNWKDYRGMGSLGAMKFEGSRERYNQISKDKLVPEGIEGLVPYKGKLKDIMFQYVGGLKSGMGYVGAKNIKEMREKADFRRLTQSGKVESHPHDVYITKESPNYSFPSGRRDRKT